MKMGSLLMLLIAVEGRAQSTEAGFNPGAVIRVYDEAGSVIETNEHASEFKEAMSERNKKPPCGEA
jgi:hypothetical protein